MYGIEPEEYTGRSILQEIDLWRVAHDYKVATLIAATEISIADQLGSVTLLGGMLHFTDVLRAIYRAPKHDGELRRIAVLVCKENVEYLMSQDRFRVMLLEDPIIAVDLLKEMAKTITVKHVM